MYGIQAGRATECFKAGSHIKTQRTIEAGTDYENARPERQTQELSDKRKNYLTVNEEAIPQYKVFRRQDSEAIKRITDRYTMEEIGKFCEIQDIISEINFEEINGA